MTRWIEAVIIRQGTIYPTNELGILNLFGKNVELFNIHQLSGEIFTSDENTQLKCINLEIIIKVSNDRQIQNYIFPEYFEIRTCKLAKLRQREKLSFVSTNRPGCWLYQLAVISSSKLK